jgi:hypothetical protein
VVPTAGVTKDAQWTQGFITAAAMQASSGVIQNCRGVNLDGTSTNRKAMRAMEEEHPHMVNLVCAAHSLDLVIKDLGNVGKTKTECGKVLQQAKDLAAAVGAR